MSDFIRMAQDELAVHRRELGNCTKEDRDHIVMLAAGLAIHDGLTSVASALRDVAQQLEGAVVALCAAVDRVPMALED